MTIGTGDCPDNLTPDSIPLIDLRFLTQSELNSLSLCSEKTFDLRRCDDVVIPKIDRSVFNESAGSRKQTYSRLRLAPRKPEISAVGRGRYNPVSKPHSNPVDDPERKENKEIVSLLRGLFGKNSEIQFKEKKLEVVNGDFEFVEEELALPILAMPVHVPISGVSPNGGPKRKRGRPRKEVAILEPSPPKPKVRKVESDDFYENVPIEENVVMEIVNKNGVVVDLAALACSEDPYAPELRKRSVGLTTEEELLAFLRELKGQWGSRRKKRKVVDASDFGDALPLGWKLLISLKRKEGHLSLYCRRYISPTGHQFVSCKEVSSYLLPFFGFLDEDHPISFPSDESDNEVNKLSSGTSAGLAHKDDCTKDEMVIYEATPIGSFSSQHETENLAEVEIRDLLECHICKTNFSEKDAYLEHLLSSHQKSTKRPRHGNTSVCDGVIIRDGKFECQFCHKIFDERHRYNGHVGNHVKSYVRSREQASGGATKQNSVKPSAVSRVLPGFSVEEASAVSDKGFVPRSSVPNNETIMQNDIKPSSVTKVLSRVDVDKGSVSPPSALSNERTVQNSIKPSSVSGVLPLSYGVEQSAAIDKGPVTPTCIPSNETTMQNDNKPSSVSGLLQGFSSGEASDAIDKSFNAVTYIPSNETTVQNNVKLSSVNVVLQGHSGVEASAEVDKDSVPPTFVTSSDINTDFPSDKMDADSNLGVSKGFPGVKTSVNIDKDSVPPTSVPSNDINTDSPCSKIETDSNIDVSTAKPKGFSGLEASAKVDEDSVPPTYVPSNDINIDSPCSKMDADPNLNVSTARPKGFSEVEASANINKDSVSPTSIPSNETNTDPLCRMMDADSNFDVSTAKPKGFSGVEAPADVNKDYVPPTSGPSNDTSTYSLCGMLDADSNLDISTANPEGFCGVEASADVNPDYVPPTSVPNSDTNTDSVCGMMDSDSNLDILTAKPKGFSGIETSADANKDSVPPTSVVSNDTNIVSPCDMMDADSNLDVSAAQPNSDQNSPHSNSNTGTCIPHSFLRNHIVENIDSPDDNFRPGAILEKHTFTSSFELSAGSPCGEQDMGDNNMDETFGGASGDEQDSDTEMTDDGESDDEKDSDTEMTDDKLGSVDKTDFNLNVDLRSCLDSTLFNNVEDGTPGTFEGKDVFTSTTDSKLGKGNHINNNLDGDFKSFLRTPTALGNNVENGTNVTYEGNNVFGGPAFGMNMSGLRQGESSFSFSFAPSGSVKANGVDICTDDIFSLSMKMPEHDKGKEYGFNLEERCFGSSARRAKEDPLIESIGIADKEPIQHGLVADVSSPSLQSSGCFPTLDLFSTKGQGESESFPFQKFDSMSGFEELGFDDLEPSKFGFVSGKESSSLTQGHMDLGYDPVMEEALNTSQFEWVINNNHQQQTALCVWCRIPFIHDGINLEMQSDSEGFMCPTCKVKISGQLNVFGQ